METEIFKENLLNVIQPPDGGTYTLKDVFTADNKDYFFVAKWNEVLERYLEARRFAEGAVQEDWGDRLSTIPVLEVKSAVSDRYKSDLYEMALINYNILVDLTWTWTYVSAEYVLYTFDKENNVKNIENIYDLCPIDEAYALLRKEEGNVLSPTAKDNPFEFLKDRCPEFSAPIDTIIKFWEKFSNNKIRKLYNFIKHKGKPLYKEIESQHKLYRKFFNKEECVSNINDVQVMISVDKELEELIKFDNEQLLPYVKTLLDQLKIAVDPSPAAYL